MTTPPASQSRTLSPELSTRLRFWSLMAMVLLVYVHAYNLHPRYLRPSTQVLDPRTWDHAVQYLFANGLLRFRIPILFAISGYLFALRDDGAKPHRTRVTKRLRTLGIPYLAWSAIALAITFALEQWPPTRELVRAAELSPFGSEVPFVSEYSAGQLVQRWLLIPAAFQLWFLRALIVLTLLYPWLRTAMARWPRRFFGFATLFWVLGINFGVVESEGLLYFSLGMWLAINNVDVMRPPGWFRAPLVLALWLTVCVVRTWMAFSPGEMGRGAGNLMLLLYRFGEVSGLLVAWFGLDGLIRIAMAQPLFRWLTGFSFMIFALHVPLVNYATEGALRAGAGIPRIELWTYLLVPLGVIAVCVAVGATLRTVARPVYSVLTGGRGL